VSVRREDRETDCDLGVGVDIVLHDDIRDSSASGNHLDLMFPQFNFCRSNPATSQSWAEYIRRLSARYRTSACNVVRRPLPVPQIPCTARLINGYRCGGSTWRDGAVL
jgi:hypothetical protein